MRARRTSGAVVAIAVSLALAGCGSSASGLAERSAGWQARVASIANGAAAGDSVAAIAELTALQAELDDARAAGAVTPARADLIRSAIDLVRADLSGLAAGVAPSTTIGTVVPSPGPAPSTTRSIDSAPSPHPVPSQSVTGDHGENGKGSGD